MAISLTGANPISGIQHYTGLSTDTFPTTSVPVNSTLVVTDKSDVVMTYNGNNWVPDLLGSGGLNTGFTRADNVAVGANGYTASDTYGGKTYTITVTANAGHQILSIATSIT